MKKTLIISAFPGTGKTYCVQKRFYELIEEANRIFNLSSDPKNTFNDFLHECLAASNNYLEEVNSMSEYVEENYTKELATSKFKSIIELDSSQFSKFTNGKPNPNFPENYIKVLKSKIGKADIIFVSTHKEVREALKREKIKYILIFPRKHLKNDFLERFKNNGYPESFIKSMNKNWNEYINSCLIDTGCVTMIETQINTFVSDIIERETFKKICQRWFN